MAMSDNLPLGLISRDGIDDETLDRLRVLETFDLHRVDNRLREHGLLPESWIPETILEFRRYLALVLTGDHVGMTSPYVDEVWHQTILFTQLYASLGQAVAGRFIHHEPNDGDDASEMSKLPDGGAGAFAEFQSAYEGRFGPLPSIWTRHEDPGGQ